MDRMHWHDSFSVGVQIVDEQHQQLFRLVNELIVAINTKQQDKVVEVVLDATLAYAGIHFRTEEELFKIHPKFNEHSVIHQKFTQNIGKLVLDFKQNKADTATGLLNYLASWLQSHILKTDIAFFSELGFRPKGTEEDMEERLNLLFNNVKVLIAEDSPSQRLLLKHNLEDSGYEVLEACNGVEALKILETTTDLHLVVTDIEMPEMNGYDFIKAIREKKIPSVYIIVITIISDRESMVKSFELGANDFLTKPIFYQELNLRLRNGINLLRLESQDELIFALAKLADSRSPEVGKHIDRVKIFTGLLARELIISYPEIGMTESIAADIARYSPLHDIGKVGIADIILNKPGKLTPKEFNIMKEHTKIGGELISGILRKAPSRSLRLAYELTMYHHEKWDGSGYPVGLSGKDIPIAAQIMALADVYDALTSDRVYKKAFSRGKARSIIVGSSNTHFNPILVEAFKTLESKFHELRQQLCD